MARRGDREEGPDFVGVPATDRGVAAGAGRPISGTGGGWLHGFSFRSWRERLASGSCLMRVGGMGSRRWVANRHGILELPAAARHDAGSRRSRRSMYPFSDTVPDEYRLEDIGQDHPIAAAVFLPFAVERLRSPAS